MFGFVNNGGGRRLLSMYCIRFELFYSTAPATEANNKLMVDLLVNSLGFSKEKAISTSNKVTILKPGNKNPSLVLDFFRQIGLDNTQIKLLVSTVPRLLFSDIEKTLKPKIKFLQELGFSESDLATVITKVGALTHTSLDTSIRSVKYLREVLDGDDLVGMVIKKVPSLISQNLSKLMPPNISVLQNAGFSSMDIKRFILVRPRSMASNPEWLEGVVRRLEKDFHISKEPPMFFHGMEAIATFSVSTLEMKLEIFRSFGWSGSDIITMVQKHPYCLTASEAKLRKGLNFFMTELGYGSSYLASHPALLKYSFEKRVLPRNEIFKLLTEKGLIKRKLCLYNVVTCAESKFMEKFVLPFRYEMPEVYDLYVKSRS